MNQINLSGDNGESKGNITENKPIDPSSLFGQPTPKSNTPNSKARRKMHYNNRI